MLTERTSAEGGSSSRTIESPRTMIVLGPSMPDFLRTRLTDLSSGAMRASDTAWTKISHRELVQRRHLWPHRAPAVSTRASGSRPRRPH